jgi:hypothetical protein
MGISGVDVASAYILDGDAPCSSEELSPRRSDKEHCWSSSNNTV